MWREIIVAFALCGAVLIGYVVYRTINTPSADTMLDNNDVIEPTPLYHCPATIQPSTCHQDVPDWLFIHISASYDVSTSQTPPCPFTIEQERRLAFVRWLIHAGRLTEWIIEEVEAQ